MLALSIALALSVATSPRAQHSESILPSWDGILVQREGRLERGHRLQGFGRTPDSSFLRRVRDTVRVRAVPNWIGSLQTDAADEPFFPQQWSLLNTGAELEGVVGVVGADIGATRAWQSTTGDSSIVVAFLDGGVDATHPELKGHLAYNTAERNGKPGVDDDGNGFVDDTLGWDFVRGDGTSRDRGGHGTSTASLVAAAWNGIGIAGIAPGIRILPIRVADGGSRVQLRSLVDGIAYATSRKVDIINLSLGGLSSPELLDSAIAKAVAAGAVVVVSAGNEAVDLAVSPRYPAASRIPGMIVVGASDSRDMLSWYSNRSAKLVDLSAPGDALIAAGIPEADTLWREDFETGLTGWVTGGTGTAWGTEAVAGSTVLSDSPGKNYPRSSRRWIRSPRLNGTKRSALLVSLVVRGRVNGADYFMVECSRDSTFAKVDDTLFVNGGFQQDSATEFVLDAGSVDGLPFNLRFSLVSDGLTSTADSGVQIDDLVLRARDLPQPEGGSYVTVWGTSFSAPLTSAAVALVKSLHPDASVTELVSAVIDGAQAEPGLTGVSRSGSRLYLPGAFQKLGTSTKHLETVPLTDGIRVARGVFSITAKGSWEFSWRDLRGRTYGTRQGVGDAEITMPQSSSAALVWTFRTDGRTFQGMVLGR